MARRRILVIEDEDAISEPLAEALEREGFDADVAGSAAEGIERFQARRPDLVLLDVMLPDGDGRDVLRDIRSRSRTPVVMLTPGGVDISGPCDEAEHANDPRCTGVQVPEDDPSPGGIDISGPCDEAEHANDPRCTGAGGAEDRSGRSSNSGPSDNSGPGKSGRDHEEDD